MNEQNYIAQAAGKYIRISPLKARLVADLIRDRYVGEALTILKYSRKKKASSVIEKVLRSAIANAQQKSPNVDVDDLYISRIFIEQGPTWKRFRARAMGRATRILKRTSHVHIFLEEKKGR
ncbi:MAG: 50S ribosomal protein L22 [Candidatus Aminicenantes bacterium 4484_214]|nr:MAG: 50S ribosomal protein L22 [Candidatus Aminicenantes bacterium 4484_214]RLE09905.1 MAG: 50S ribosomal protein L22 [Candidatus Aminicenantes bacterium]HDJ23537.1 50S ribosomal protein L22 [Candidatus Aminicenantes bacterium]